VLSSGGVSIPPMTKPWNKIFLCLVLVTLVGCVKVRPGYIEDDKRDAAAVIDRVHTLYNARDFAALYDGSHPAVKKAQSKQQMIQFMDEKYQTFGGFKTCTYSKLNVVMGAPVETRAVYNCNFEKRDATELFILIRDEDTMKVAQYQIRSGTVRPNSE
jgi:hypothetical protein